MLTTNEIIDMIDHTEEQLRRNMVGGRSRDYTLGAASALHWALGIADNPFTGGQGGAFEHALFDRSNAVPRATETETTGWIPLTEIMTRFGEAGLKMEFEFEHGSGRIYTGVQGDGEPDHYRFILDQMECIDGRFHLHPELVRLFPNTFDDVAWTKDDFMYLPEIIEAIRTITQAEVASRGGTRPEQYGASTLIDVADLVAAFQAHEDVMDLHLIVTADGATIETGPNWAVDREGQKGSLSLQPVHTGPDSVHRIDLADLVLCPNLPNPRWITGGFESIQEIIGAVRTATSVIDAGGLHSEDVVTPGVDEPGSIPAAPENRDEIITVDLITVEREKLVNWLRKKKRAKRIGLMDVALSKDPSTRFAEILGGIASLDAQLRDYGMGKKSGVTFDKDVIELMDIDVPFYVPEGTQSSRLNDVKATVVSDGRAITVKVPFSEIDLHVRLNTRNRLEAAVAAFAYVTKAVNKRLREHMRELNNATG